MWQIAGFFVVELSRYAVEYNKLLMGNTVNIPPQLARNNLLLLICDYGTKCNSLHEMLGIVDLGSAVVDVSGRWQ